MKEIKLTRNPFLLFAPFLILYFIVIVIFRPTGTVGDESRYLIYAQYMITGILPDSEVNFDTLGNGPGYSIILIPFVALHISVLWMTLMNAIFYYLSIVLLYKVLLQFVGISFALIVSIFWACFFNLYESIIFLLPETFTVFLICLLIFCVTKAFKNKDFKNINWYIYFSGFLMGFTALTKPIFGYVFLCMLILIGIIYIFKIKIINYKKAFIILLAALLTNLPYLIYTYHITHKMFYWSTVGGNNLYWMSTPYESEYGDWFPDLKPNSIHSADKLPNSHRQKHIELNHSKDFEIINKHINGPKRDDAYKRIALNNIKLHPIKFIKNCASNLGRILFNFPYSYKYQQPGTLLRLPLNGVIIVFSLFCLIPTFKNWKKINFSIRFLLLFTTLYLGGSLLGSAETRMFTIIVPILLIWIAVIIEKSIKVNLHWQ
jgi:4-amino-4-deoxy-L-arabinose transferase-like glycosyltransferase